MMKNILIVLGILSSIFLMFGISLTNGFKIDNISYKNINIHGLYLKYDKKLIIDTRNISISYAQGAKKVDMKIKFSIENFFDNYFIEVYEYVLFEPYLKASGKFILDLENFSLDKITNTVINDFALQFNNNLKFIKAQHCYVEFVDNNFYFSFEKPQYEGVDLEGSKATILDLDRLKLELTSKDNLKQPLLELLINYKINLPISQEYGENSIFTNLVIPFDINKDIEVDSKITLKNSKIILYSIPLYAESFQIDLSNNILKGEGRLRKLFDTDTNLEYQSEVEFQIDFEQKRVQGRYKQGDLKFKEIQLQKLQGDFLIDFSEDYFFSEIFINEGVLKIKEEEFFVKNGETTYQDQPKTFFTNLELHHTKHPLVFNLEDRFSLLDTNSTGEAKINYNDGEISTQTLFYNANFNEDVQINFDMKELTSSLFQNRLKINDAKLYYNENQIKGEIKNLTLQNDNITLTSNNIFTDINLLNKLSFTLDTNNSSLFIGDFDTALQTTQLTYQNNKIEMENLFKNGYFQFDLTTQIDTALKKATGVLTLQENQQENSKQFGYSLDYQKGVDLRIPDLDLKFEQTQKDTVQFSVDNLIPLKNHLKFILVDNKSRLNLIKKEDGVIDINLFHISMILDEYYDNLLLKEKSKPLDIPEINMVFQNGFTQFHNFKFYYDTLKVKTLKQENLSLELQKGKTKIVVNKNTNNTLIQSNYVDADYINLVYGKNILKNGYIDLFVSQNSTNIYQGTVNLYDTTIVKLQLVDNLLLFLNSTPALINPLLAIPTLFRMTQNDFELGGYYIEKGLLNFNYNTLEKYLDIYHINTKGKINDFSGDISLNFVENSIEGNLFVSTLKDYAKVVSNIPIINFIFLDEKGKFSIPISIYGTIDEPNYSIKNKKSSK